MAYQTILVHLSADPDHILRLAVASELAARFGAHLTAVYNPRPLGMPAEIEGRGASLGYLAAAAETARERAAAVAEECAERCRRDGVALDWRVAEGEHTATLGAYARLADLTIVSRHPSDLEHRLGSAFPDDLPMVSGGPVLMLPRGYRGKKLGTRPLLAWKSTPQAARAARDAVPLLLQAADTVVLTVADEIEEEQSGHEVAAALARHGAKVEVSVVQGSDRHAGEIVLERAATLERDLIVMGFFGRSRFRELVLGGASRYALDHAAVPLLVSH